MDKCVSKLKMNFGNRPYRKVSMPVLAVHSKSQSPTYLRKTSKRYSMHSRSTSELVFGSLPMEDILDEEFEEDEEKRNYTLPSFIEEGKHREISYKI